MRILLAILATYRLAFLLVYEDGPAELITRLRSYILTEPISPLWVQKGIECVLCVSFWLAWLIALLLPAEKRRDYPLNGLGIAGGVLILQHIVQTRE